MLSVGESGVVRRRGTLEQGKALETLGHAVEYLVDSRLFLTSQESLRDSQESVKILMQLSRAVFAECPEVVPVHRRLSRWVRDRMSVPGRTRIQAYSRMQSR